MSAADNIKYDLCGKNHHPMTACHDAPSSLAAPTGSEFADVTLMLWSIQLRMESGCGNHGCRIRKGEGMATNGPCRCTAKSFASELRDIAEMLSPNAQAQRPALGGKEQHGK
jgi:hypothetical protein